MESLFKINKHKSIICSKFLNLPDLHFFNWCNQRYGINKGVYNTIDEWFFQEGNINILARRILLLAFLEYISDKGLKHENHKFIKFGNGGLVKRLKEFNSIF
ncbi:hypothetical protein [Cytobacillus oceanisediminis]|uniref:hypothetical protein n=1 Tax=Cytobacillus oceanisediminis TaxID=665099 RepID=UPI001CF1FBBB|nr:hypothetical protein [Cytobacillus oceanisediminis]